MSWIKTVAVGKAEGRLRRSYEAAIARAGRVFKIVQLMSLSPHVLDASMELYEAVMLAPGALSRRHKELLAVVVSRANRCHY